MVTYSDIHDSMDESWFEGSGFEGSGLDGYGLEDIGFESSGFGSDQHDCQSNYIEWDFLSYI